ncbi:MAG TPA: flagellar hook-length control protein FliK [Dissulfurispiraceae bacterium]|nr:flagellar hook-length control protein FliK [Dissulfurispiraceae bacterium]
MTTATVPVFAQSAAAQAGPSNNAASASNNAPSGQGFAGVLRSVIQRLAGENQQDFPSMNNNTPAQELPDAGEIPFEQGDAVAFSMIQQMLVNLPATAQMTPAQIQTLAQEVLNSLAQAQIENGMVSRGQIVENIVKSLQGMKKESGAESFQKAPGNIVAEAIDALKSVQDEGTSVVKEVSTLKSHPDSAQVTAKASRAELFDALASSVNEREAPDVMLSTTRQSSVYALQGGVHRLADASLSRDVNGDVSVTSIRDIHEPIRAAAETGTKQMILRLDPPGLGDVQIRLRVQQGVLTADLKVDSSSIRDLFTSVLPQIRHQLENSGIRVGELQVDLRDDYPADQGQRRGQDQRQQQQQDRQTGGNFFEYLA